MFQFPAFASIMDDISSIYRVAPFGNLRIKGYLHLPEAYRSLSRPSSPLRAKASAMRPYLLISYFIYNSYTDIFSRFSIRISYR